MTSEEYQEITENLGEKNFLVFGTGYDSDLWRNANKKGVTIFLEHDDKWIPKDSNDVIKVKYTTTKPQYKDIIDDEKALTMELPDIVKNTKWDIIFVDSPTGYSKKCHGRMQSIYAAKLLSDKDTLVYIHDCNRRVENLYSKTFFKIEREFTKLRKCRI
jgi:uncharacterized protein (TIGR01627 family)